MCVCVSSRRTSWSQERSQLIAAHRAALGVAEASHVQELSAVSEEAELLSAGAVMRIESLSSSLRERTEVPPAPCFCFCVCFC